MSEQNPYAPPEANVAVQAGRDSDLASRWARFGGAIVDSLIMMAIVWAGIYLLGYFDTMVSGAQTLKQTAALGLSAFGAFILVNGYLLATRGQSVGKMVAGTRIVSVSDGRILPFGKLLLLRLMPSWLINYVPFVGAIAGLIDSLFVFRKDRRCVHDWIAGTKVVVANPID